MNGSGKKYGSLSRRIVGLSYHLQAIFELINTESAYVRDLQMIVGVFYANILPLLEEKAATVIFANVEDILLVNTVN